MRVGFLRAPSAMLLKQSASCLSHRKAVYDGFGAEDVATSGTSRRRYRPCLNTWLPFAQDAPFLELAGTTAGDGRTGGSRFPCLSAQDHLHG
jgi:hypothetical protein